MSSSMEWITSFFLGFLVFSAIVQLFWSYALSSIAQKGGQSDLMQILAWIPLLQVAPMIIAGGGSLAAFLIGSIGLFVGAIALGVVSAFLGGTVGGAIGTLCMAFLVLLVLIYFGRLCWTMAVDRGLSGWVGLLLFVPILNFFVYPYIAFHDGWSSPNKIGLVIGLVLTVGSTAPSFKAVSAMNEAGGLPPEFMALLSGDTAFMDLLERQHRDSDAGKALSGISTVNSDGIEIDPVASIRALYSMQDRYERLRLNVESPGIEKREQNQQALDLLRSIEAELKAHRSVIDSPTYQQLTIDLMETEARIQQRSNPGEGSGGTISQKPSSTRATGAGNRFEVLGGPAAMSFGSANRPAPARPIPIQPADECPNGTELRSRQGQSGEEEWCQQLDELGGLRHGWYAKYLHSGQPESMGEYENGLRVGVWTRFYASGRVRAQAEFAQGLQQGWLLSFDESGERTKAVRFEQGAVLR